MIRNTTPRRVLAVVLGNVILGIGIAGLKLSLMGNDSYTACMLALSDGLHMGQGNFQLAVNLVLLVIQFLWGCSYIGFGTLINMCLLGYLVQYSAVLMEMTIGSAAGHGMVYCLVYMLVSFLVVAFGLSMYQTADLGVSPYDYLAIGLTDHSKRPYFANRVLCDASCVAIILAAVLTGFIGWGNSHLGIGTVCGAFCLGPFVSLSSKINQKWIR